MDMKSIKITSTYFLKIYAKFSKYKYVHKYMYACKHN